MAEKLNNDIICSERDAEIFFDAVLGDVQPPSENLVAAAKKYKQKMNL